MLKRLSRAPLLHFALIGGVLHWAVALWPAASAGVIEVRGDDLARLQRAWHAESGRLPTPPELRASLQRYLDDEVLLAEALRLGLDQRDAVARQRLLQNLDFALPGFSGDESARIAEARALGMPARDLVVRRRLIQLMEHRLVGEIALDEAALRAYVSAHAARYAPPARLALRQVFYSRDRAAADVQALATQTLQDLRANPQIETATLGDPFLFGDQAAALTPELVARRYGADFSRALVDADVGEWIGPLETAYGWHLVRIDARDSRAAPDYEAVRLRAAYAWRAEQERRVLQQRLLPLRQRYGVASVDRVLERLRS